MTARQYREGAARCARCGTRHAHVNHHEDGTLVGAEDRPDLALDILAAYAAIDGHASMIGMRDVICPKPPPRTGTNVRGVDRRTREGRAWVERVALAWSIELDLCDRGLMRNVDEPCGPDGKYPWGLAITEEGRAYLAAGRQVDDGR